MRILALFTAAIVAGGCGRERAFVFVYPTGHEGSSEAVRLGRDGAVVAHEITLIKGNYNVLEWRPCRRIETVRIQDDGAGSPVVSVEYSDKECGR